MGLSLTIAPAAEPITTEEVKLHSRIDTDVDDAKISVFIKAARRLLESITHRQFVTATYTLTLDRFPTGDMIELPRAPLGAVTSITYADSNNADVEFSSASYSEENSIDAYGRIYVDRSVGWPTTYDKRNAISIVYTAGYGDAAAVPEEVKQAIYLTVANWYENRESVAPITMTEVPQSVGWLIDNLKIRGDVNAYACGLTQA